MDEAGAWTPEDYDAEIRRLQDEKDKLRKTLDDPEQRGKRWKRRAQIFGDWAIPKFTWTDEHMDELRAAAGEQEQWLLDKQLLELDGWTGIDKGKWKAPKAPEDG